MQRWSCQQQVPYPLGLLGPLGRPAGTESVCNAVRAASSFGVHAESPCACSNTAPQQAGMLCMCACTHTEDHMRTFAAASSSNPLTSLALSRQSPARVSCPRLSASSPAATAQCSAADTAAQRASVRKSCDHVVCKSLVTMWCASGASAACRVSCRQHTGSAVRCHTSILINVACSIPPHPSPSHAPIIIPPSSPP